MTQPANPHPGRDGPNHSESVPSNHRNDGRHQSEPPADFIGISMAVGVAADDEGGAVVQGPVEGG